MGFKSRKDHKKDRELEEARKAGIVPAEVDEDGKEINPHIPQYISSSPWYLNTDKPGLNHQRKRKKPDLNDPKPANTNQADKCGKDACDNCGAKTHATKSCTERTRKRGAKWTGKNIAPDEKIKTSECDYDAKRDRWNGCDVSLYSHVINERFEAREEARVKYLKDEKLKKLDDEAKVDESEQTNFGKVEKRVRTTGGGSTGTVRNLRIREDPAKYLLNLDVNSAHYDPKTRSMREDPLPDMDPNEKFYGGDNANRVSGEALEFKRLNMHVEAINKGNDYVHMQGAPSQTELMCKDYMVNQERVKSKVKGAILEKYGNAGAEEELPRELLLGQSEIEVEYDRAGRLIKGHGMVIVKGKYEEDVYVNNHTDVWGSWWKDHQWGYGCCKQFLRNSYCTGTAGTAYHMN